VLLVHGTARLEVVDGVPTEYVEASLQNVEEIIRDLQAAHSHS
jgi:hypothetical protein